jgi:hypothetical protein
MPDFDPIGKMAAINAIMAGFHARIQMLFAKRVYRRAATDLRQGVPADIDASIGLARFMVI